jgi:hypothetical protein
MPIFILSYGGTPPPPPKLTKQLANLSVYNATAARFLKHFKDFVRKYAVIKDGLDHFEENFCKNYTDYIF